MTEADLADQRPSLVDGSRYEELDFARRFGFGIAQDMMISMSGELANLQPTENERYIQGLSPDAQLEYQHALYGTEENAPVPGCYEEAAKSMENITVIDQEDESDLYQRARNDPRILAFLDQWRACMREKGFSATDPDDLIEQFDRRVAEDLDTIVEQVADGAIAIERAEQLQIDALKSLQSDEIAAAVSNLDCGGGLEAGRQLLRDVMDELRSD